MLRCTGMTLSTGLFLAWMTASGADAATTIAARHHGAAEANPLMAHTGVMLTEKAAIGTLQIIILKKWEAKHPVVVRLISAGMASYYTTIAISNYKVYRAQRVR